MLDKQRQQAASDELDGWQKLMADAGEKWREHPGLTQDALACMLDRLACIMHGHAYYDYNTQTEVACL